MAWINILPKIVKKNGKVCEAKKVEESQMAKVRSEYIPSLERTKRSFYSHPSRENEWIVLHSHLSKENESIVQHSHLSRENKSIVLHSHLSRENERKSRERRYRPPVVHQIRVPPTLRHTHS